MLDTVSPAFAATLTQAIARLVRDDLAGNRAIWLAGNWDKSVDTYSRQFRKLMASYCSACQYPVQQNVAGVLRINVTHAAQASPQVMNALVAAAQLPQHVQACLDAGNCRTVWVWMNIRWPQGGGHAAFMLFDVKRRRQIYFDPHWGMDMANSVSTQVCQRQFHPQYQPVALADCAWPTQNVSMQHLIQQHLHFDEHGMCGILSTIVIITCIRFNYFNPLHVARMMTQTMAQQGAHVANQMITWYDELIPKSGDAYRLHAFPNSTADRCHAFSTGTRRLCSRRSCRQGPLRCFCWQHRWLGMNRSANGRGCAQPQAQC